MDISITRRTLLAAAALLGLAGRAPPRPWPREVLAFYYGWWGLAASSGARRHWGDERGGAPGVDGSPHFPARGLYDSLDPADVAWQVEQAQKAGVTGFVASWWGRDRFEDSNLGLLLRQAARSDFRVCAYYETTGEGPREGEAAVARIAADLAWLARRHMTSPAWLTVRGRPVLFVYERVLQEVEPPVFAAAVARLRAGGGPAPFVIGPSEFVETRAERAPWFDALHAYSVVRDVHDANRLTLPFEIGKRYRREIEAAGGDLACLTVSPGYDDRELPDRAPPRPVLKRRDGATYRLLWEAALRARPDWVLITSWNEWHEGSEIEPSLEHGERELATTRKMARRFRGI